MFENRRDSIGKTAKAINISYQSGSVLIIRRCTPIPIYLCWLLCIQVSWGRSGDGDKVAAVPRRQHEKFRYPHFAQRRRRRWSQGRAQCFAWRSLREFRLCFFPLRSSCWSCRLFVLVCVHSPCISCRRWSDNCKSRCGQCGNRKQLEYDVDDDVVVVMWKPWSRALWHSRTDNTRLIHPYGVAVMYSTWQHVHKYFAAHRR